MAAMKETDTVLSIDVLSFSGLAEIVELAIMKSSCEQRAFIQSLKIWGMEKTQLVLSFSHKDFISLYLLAKFSLQELSKYQVPFLLTNLTDSCM